MSMSAIFAVSSQIARNSDTDLDSRASLTRVAVGIPIHNANLHAVLEQRERKEEARRPGTSLDHVIGPNQSVCR